MSDTIKSEHKKTNSQLILVGVGASAGGLEALTPFVANLPLRSNMAYIIAQHVSPQHRSMMVELLSRSTKLRVVEAEHQQKIERNVIYITPPKHDVSVDKTKILLSDPHSSIGAKPSINYLYASMAEHFGENAIGVILSGTGSDGTQGARALVTRGGIVIAQDSVSAKYDSMPRSAVRAEVVDLILKPDDAARQLERIAATPRDELARVVETKSAALVRELVERIFKATGHDFRNYKEATISRQIQRRIIALQIPSPEAYVRYTEENPGELKELQKTFLISVTAFYRDQDSFLALRGVLSNIIKSKSPGDRIRIWVPACATGEEVYTIAYLVADLLGNELHNYNVKIFGTDMSASATDVARAGVYPEAALDEISPEIRERYFGSDTNGYRVKKFVREMVLFAQHDLIQDPPFLKMDLVSCRNLLIYLKQSLQEKLFSLFHYSLSPKGYLFLGKSETVGSNNPLFSTLDHKSRLYRRRDVATPRLMPISGARLEITTGSATVKRKQESREYIAERLNELYTPPSVLITSNFEPVHFVGDLSSYLSFPTGAANFSLFALLAPEIRAEMRALVHKCISSGDTITGHLLPMKKGNEVRRVRPVMRTMEIFDTGEFGVLISFEEHVVIKGSMESVPENIDEVTRERFLELETELSGTRDHLQAVIEELETSNEELQSLNEEMQASSEELQASNEELETTNEELQATNEEMATVNDELEEKSTQIADMNDILENIQTSVNSPIVVLDARMNVVRFSPQTVRLFGIMESDIGSPITSITCHVGITNLDIKLRSVINDGETIVEESGSNNAHYVMQLAPYIDHHGNRKGAVMSFTDISEITESRRARAQEEEKFRRITESLQEVVWMAAADSKTLLYVSPNASEQWGISTNEILENPKAFLSIVHKDDRARVLAERKPKSGNRWSIEYRIVLPSGEIRWVRDQGAAVVNDAGNVTSLVGSSIDITPRVNAESALRASEAQFKAVFRSSGVGVAILSPEGELLEANNALEQYLGYGKGELSNVHFVDITVEDDSEEDLNLFGELVRGERQYYSLEKRYRTKGGGILWGHLTVTFSPATDDYDAFAVGVVTDISDRIKREKVIHRQANFDSVTSLPNRGMVRRQLVNTIAGLDEGMSASMFFIDLDGFKHINDTYGHNAGDTVLREFGTRLSENIRAFDSVARWGGDEFVCILNHGRNGANVEEIAQRVIELSHASIQVAGGEARISSSVGIATFPADASDADALIQAADLAMYDAKRAGKNCYRVYNDKMSEGVTVRMHAQKMLDQALNSNALSMHYQPIFDSTQKNIIAAEALLRWEHPDDGLVSPFADYLEHATSQMLDDIDRWATETVMREVEKSHKKLPPDLRIHVNVFPERLERNSFVAQVLHGKKKAYFKRMTLELTEREFEFNSEGVINTLSQLRKAGVRISIDDFGTGYSSLGMLSSVEVDQIKIDKLFVDEIMTDTLKGLKFIDSVVGLAEGLRLEVVAEGIEHQAQLDEVAAMVAGLQGYLLAKPMPMEELIDFAKQDHKKKA